MTRRTPGPFRAVPGTTIFLVVLFGSLLPFAPKGAAETAPAEHFILPTANRALFAGRYPDYFMYVPRQFGGKSYQVWQGGMYGFVRTPVTHAGTVLYRQFHEGMDIKPLRRDKLGNPLDPVWSVAPGKVVHVNLVSGKSNYGKYVVVEHPCADGPYYSLYAHLMTAEVTPGETVRQGSVLGRLGYTGRGINRTRAHLHFEINLLLHRDFDRWFAESVSSVPNAHGAFNGLNLAGIDVMGWYLAMRQEPELCIRDFLAREEPYFRVVVPKKGSDLDCLDRYPWLLREDSAGSVAWEIAFHANGMPVAITGTGRKVDAPLLTWTKSSPFPHTYATRKRLTGSGDKARLTGSGLSYVNLVTGRF